MMNANVVSVFDRVPPMEHLAPALNVPVGGPINGHRQKDYRTDFDRLQADMASAWRFATKHHLAVLTVAGDRNGAYLVIAPSPKLKTLFGDEAARWRMDPATNGMRVEYWLGLIGNIRVFWREVTCVH